MEIDTTVGLLLRAQVITKDGKVRYDSGIKPADCFLANLFPIWATIWSDSQRAPYLKSTGSIDNVGLVVKSSWDSQSAFISIKYPDSEVVGITIGDNNVIPVDWSDTNLANYIGDGVNPGELQYGTMDYSDAPKVVSGGIEWTLFRDFTNGSGGNVTVKEIGLISQYNSTYYALIARDLLASSIVVADSEVLRVFYTFRTEDGFTLQFLQIIADIWTFRSKATLIKQVDGDSVAITSTANWDAVPYPMSMYYAIVSDDIDKAGIIVGSGDTAESVTDYALDAKIEAGDGVGELRYNIMYVFAQTSVGYEQFKPNLDGYMRIRFERVFNNRSGASITIREVGLTVAYASNTEGDEALIIRKVLDTPKVLANDEYTRVFLTIMAKCP